MATLIPKLNPATIKFVSEDKRKKKKSSSFDKTAHGYYCDICNRIFADFSAEN